MGGFLVWKKKTALYLPIVIRTSVLVLTSWEETAKHAKDVRSCHSIALYRAVRKVIRNCFGASLKYENSMPCRWVLTKAKQLLPMATTPRVICLSVCVRQKPKPKVNHNRRKEQNEPMRTQSKYTWPAPSAGKRVWSLQFASDWLSRWREIFHEPSNHKA